MTSESSMGKGLSRRSFIKCLLIPLLCAAVGCVLLLLVAIIPEDAIYDNALESSIQLRDLGDVLLDSDNPACILDPYTDQQIIMETYTMSISRPSSVLLNPRYYGEDGDGGVHRSDFYKLITGDAEYDNNYLRYWMGFRVLYRPLLTITDYFGILKIMAMLGFSLLFCAFAYIGKRRGLGCALCFAIATALVSPEVIMNSLQYCICFILAAVFIMLVLKAEETDSLHPSLFCIFGALVQFFDFYTTPLLCLGFPLLVVMSSESYRHKRWRILFTACLAWLYGYVAMWLMKLLIVTVFTDMNGFADGFRSMAGRVGIKQVPGLEVYYNIGMMFKTIWWVCCPGHTEKELLIALALCVLCGTLLIFPKRGFRALISSGSLLAVSLLPIMWFCVAAQPSRMHACFQYRIIAVSYAAVFLFLRDGLICRRQSKPDLSLKESQVP